MTFREHLYPPASWLIIGGLFCLSTAGVFLIWLGPVWAIGVLVGLTALIGGWIASTTTTISVNEDAVRVGRAHIGWDYVSKATVLDRDATTRRLGVDADARAWVVVPAFLRQAVEIGVTDDVDPHPYWLIGTRKPEELAHAINSHVSHRHV